MQDPTRSDFTKDARVQLAYQRSAAHGYHGPHNVLNPLCLSGSRIPRPTMS